MLEKRWSGISEREYKKRRLQKQKQKKDKIIRTKYGIIAPGSR